MNIFEVLSTNPWAWWLCAGIIGLIIGSFLNVVILRLPRMMEFAWRQECQALLDEPPQDSEPVTLSRPASHCPQCHAPVRAWQNIPVISYLLLRGRCAQCGTPISLQYPLVELAAGIIGVWCALQFGLSFAAVAAIGFGWTLLALTVIDARTQLLPDSLVLPLLWAGLLVNIDGTFAPLSEAVIGAAAGYLSLWSVYHGFKLLTGKEGMGHGDFKLLAALGAWVGWTHLPFIILGSSVVGAVIGIALIASGRMQQGQPMPFGPYLAIAGWLVFLFGDTWLAGYLNGA